MSDTPRTDAAAAAGGHQLSNIADCSRELERENATLRAAFRWFSKYPEFVPNMADHGERVNADIAKANAIL